MNPYKNLTLRLFSVSIYIACSCFFSQAKDLQESLWNRGITMTENAIAQDNMIMFDKGLKLLEKGIKKDKTPDKCYELAQLYGGVLRWNRDTTLLPDGRIYPKSDWFSWDEKKALKWYEEGAKLGDLKSALVLYKKYKPKNEPYSILAPKKEWNEYFKARDKSWKYAGIALQAEIPSNFSDYITLGDAAYFTNNKDLAHKYFAKGADNGEYGAIDEVISEEEALTYLTSAKAMYDAGIAMWKRGKEMYGRHDKENGYIMFEKSAKLGYSDAQKQMGYIYLTGQTVEPDTLKAVSWYKLAAKQNHTDVPFLLGKLYANGKGIDKDVDKAFEYFKESVDSGYVHSELPLAYCYLYGLGTPKDMNKAREYFQAYFARLKHAPEARLYQSGSFIMDLDYLLGLTYYFEASPQAIPLFEASLKNNTFYHSQRADLLYKFASCYEEGKCGLLKNSVKRKAKYEEAMKFGDCEIYEKNIIF